MTDTEIIDKLAKAGYERTAALDFNGGKAYANQFLKYLQVVHILPEGGTTKLWIERMHRSEATVVRTGDVARSLLELFSWKE